MDSVLKKNGNNYPQAFLKECKYVEKEVIKHIIQDPEISTAKYWNRLDFYLMNILKSFKRVNIVSCVNFVPL